jgi:hypothetical protein
MNEDESTEELERKKNHNYQITLNYTKYILGWGTVFFVSGIVSFKRRYIF